MDDGAAGRVEAARPEVAVYDRFDVPTCGGDSPDVDIAVILDGEEDRVPIPDGLADGRKRAALTVELLGQHPSRSRRDVDDGDAVVARPVEAAGTPVTGDRGAVR